MSRTYEVFSIGNLKEFKWQMLNWASRFNICAFMDSNEYNLAHQSLRGVLAVGSIAQEEACFRSDNATYFERLQTWAALQNDWIFGHLSFDLAAITEKAAVKSKQNGFIPACFYVPEIVVEILENAVRIGSITVAPKEIFDAIAGVIIQDVIVNTEAAKNTAYTDDTEQVEQNQSHRSNRSHQSNPIDRSNRPNQINQPRRSNHLNRTFMPVIDQATYLASVKSLQDHIRRGDCYEINFCQEFSTTIPDLDPVTTYIRLQEASPAPFAAFYKWNDNYVLCASPERYLRKSKDNIYSQPMKGTAKRNHEDAVLDALQKTNLQQDPKERAENIIVVDLVRNDLSKVAARGTVEVEELCGVYSFPQVHQMTSTIKAVVKSDTSWVEIIKATFPMGSMTGAPKKKVLELTTAYEPSARGIYSGSIGYVHPNGDFDFNVVIRSLVYNQTTGDLSYHVGSGITIHSVAEKEYEECLLKAAGILSAISNHHQLSTQESVE